MVMQFGGNLALQLPLAETARRIEELGYDYVAVGEHVAFHSPTSNAFVALAVAAGATRTIRLLSAITILPLYPAALAAKLTAELAHRSGERFDLGAGIGGEFPAEFEACGVDPAERVARLEEGLEVIGRLLYEEHVTFEGRFTSLTDITLMPRPARAVPIWLGGRKEPAMRRAARFADVWMPYLYTPEQFARSITTIREQAVAFGRAADAVDGGLLAFTAVGDDGAACRRRAGQLLSVTYGSDMRSAAERYVLAGTPEEVAERILAYGEAGVSRLIFSPVAEDGTEHMAMLDRIANEVIPWCQDG
jgi:alkanesulfonate monooxygenase SsuD/methylene tetrahydromethanopterin reductase-like flavin-dependent oxidoreductase (luciferase family)